MSEPDWADEEGQRLVNYGPGNIAAALREAERRGRVAELHHAAAKALRYAERELYDELTARADELEKQG